MSQTKIKAGGFDADVITGTDALTTPPSSTDEILISDNGTIKRIDYSLIGNEPAFIVSNNTATSSISANTWTQYTMDNEILDTDNAFASNAFTVPSNKGGLYFFSAEVSWSTNPNAGRVAIAISVDGSRVAAQWESLGDTTSVNQSISAVVNLSAGEVVDVDLYHTNSGNTENTGTGAFFSGFRIARGI
tara:strand:+ start:43 stop:609 length:567 start_codon:yes stop_codon:yes gene_type:complete